MANPLAGLFGSGQPSNPNFNNLMGLVGQFNQFKNGFKGNPEQIVQELRRSGKMSEAQFRQLSQLANQFQNVMK